jgi:peptidoglycan/xylan/chitin deacetylase (PgdA/CDA1 family)
LDAAKHIVLTFDLEEFDLPLEYGCNISPDEQINITNDGMKKVIALLDKYNIRATFFVTSVFAQANPYLIIQLASKHEIASHSHSHGAFFHEDYKKSKQILEEISQSQIKGFRMPRFGKVDFEELIRCGYIYDSSLNPTYIPLRYNHFSMPRNPYSEPVTGLTVFPVSVSPYIRFPLFWLSFKNLPFAFYSYLCRMTLNYDKYLHLYFHPWEFAELKSYNLPSYIKRQDGNLLTGKFENLLVDLMIRGRFLTASEFIEKGI